jgi:type I restriction enzyme S subunit
VEQDPTEEPALALLARIRDEKRRFLGDKGLERQERLAEARTSELTQIQLPVEWTLATLGSLVQKITDGTHKTPVYLSAGVPFISVKDFSGGRLDLSGTRFISEEEHAVLYKRCDPRRGDILIGRIGTLGKAVLVDTDVEFSLFVSVGLIRFSHSLIAPAYLCLALNSPYAQSEFDAIKVGGGTHTNKLNLSDLHTVGLPLPPLAEQHRIVAKVDELMALCDELEAAQAKRERRRDRLVAATLHGLNNGDASTEPGARLPFEDTARFYFNHLPRLTTRPEHIHQLRQTILTLAVKGRLVPQDPKEEPASKILARIVEARKLLAGNMAVDTYPGTFESEEQMEVPDGWKAVRFHEILLTIQTGPFGSSLHQQDYEEGGTPVINPASIQNERIVPISKMAVGRQTLERLATFKLRKNDVIMGRRGEMGRCAVVTEKEAGWLCGTGSLVLRFTDDISPWFIVKLMRAPGIQSYLGGASVGATMQNLNQSILREMPLGLPPSAEQHRIVARVDELMALCDELETRLTATTTTRRQLLEATLHEALEGGVTQSG